MRVGSPRGECPYQGVARIDGVAALLAVLISIVEIGITFLPGGTAEAATVVDWFTLFQSQPFIGLAFVSLSVMAYAALAEYQFNVLGATVFHLAINLTAALVAGLVLDFSLPFAIAYGVIAALVAAGVVLARRELSFFKLSSVKPV